MSVLDVASRIALWLLMAVIAASFLFAAIAWPVFGIKEPTLGLIIAAPFVGFMWLATRETR